MASQSRLRTPAIPKNNGLAEGAVRDVEAQVRVLRFATEALHGPGAVIGPQNPPSHGHSITYNCSTEGYNRFEDDFEQSSLTLDCLAENKFSLTTWPKCVASKFN